MSSLNIPTLSYAIGATAFFVLTVLLLTAWKGRLQGGLLLVASGVTAIWAGAAAIHAWSGVPPFSALQLLEILRNSAWFMFLLGLLGYKLGGGKRQRPELRLAGIGLIGGCVFMVALTLYHRYVTDSLNLERTMASELLLFGHVLMAVVGLALVVQIYRYTPPDKVWAMKFLCYGIGGLFVFDFYMYSHTLLVKQIDPAIWTARGLICALIVPLIAVSAARNPQWTLPIFVSRHVVLHSTTLFGAGLYLLLMSAAGYYIRLYGGTWGGVAQMVFLFGAILMLIVLMLSGNLRSRIRVIVEKHFFRNRYDYREEWLRVTKALSNSHQSSELQESIIRAICEIVDSDGGIIWLREASGHFQPASSWNTVVPDAALERADSNFIKFLQETEWVIDLKELAREPSHYRGLEEPNWVTRINRPWVLMPFSLGSQIVGFILLLTSNTKKTLNWEDRDLLKTVGSQAASYLALIKTTEELTDARQFEAFNRLSAYVVHDLKNLVAQLSLVVSNAERHMKSPGFMEDAILTVDNATQKMNRLLGHLRKDRGRTDRSATAVDLGQILSMVRDRRAHGTPEPILDLPEQSLFVRADPERLEAVIEHLVQNAQEATPDSGEVRVRLFEAGAWAVVDVEDTGCGMEPKFIAQRLFRPFDTTKGNAGMGVGVYESREFIVSLGGDINVTSKVGEGTSFKVRLPVVGQELADISISDHAEAAS